MDFSSISQIRRGRRAALSSTSQGSAEPLCSRINGASREVSERKVDLRLRSVFFLRGPTRSGERARFVALFQGCTGLRTAGCWLARRLHQLKASTTIDLRNSNFLFPDDLWSWETWACWSNLIGAFWPLCCWERWPWVGGNNPSRSRLLSI